ncbi:hypothetical protein CDD83_1514 [Cordyceps sp. RAO-2017]|nr:hypothetical protein CDD83_1514 [Cordyceps sp. RAO-2017]
MKEFSLPCRRPPRRSEGRWNQDGAVAGAEPGGQAHTSGPGGAARAAKTAEAANNGRRPSLGRPLQPQASNGSAETRKGPVRGAAAADGTRCLAAQEAKPCAGRTWHGQTCESGCGTCDYVVP